MSRTVSWFSCGAASSVATKLSNPDVIAYCDTGAEHPDNIRYMKECEEWFGKKITILKNDKFKDTFAVWEKRRYLAGIAGAPCTVELKVTPRILFQEADDHHIMGYTADPRDVTRADRFTEHFHEISVSYPLIERGLTKAACLDMIIRAGIKPPIMYELGFHNNNCIPCPKAKSPAYWALIRKEFPEQFERTAKLCHEVGARLTVINEVRMFIDEIPVDWPTTNPIVPSCDFLCAIAEKDLK
tara:strand:- start:95 stop:820 length:726 start_codon:yes stop_codon:yes gene_type:complete